MDRVFMLLLTAGIISLIYAHHSTVIPVVDCSDGTFTELHVFERMREMNPAYVYQLSCTHREMRRDAFYDERSLRSYIKR